MQTRSFTSGDNKASHSTRFLVVAKTSELNKYTVLEYRIAKSEIGVGAALDGGISGVMKRCLNEMLTGAKEAIVASSLYNLTSFIGSHN